MQSRGGQAQRREQPIDDLDAATTHECNGAVEGLRQPSQQVGEFTIHHDRRGRLGELEQGAVDIEE